MMLFIMMLLLYFMCIEMKYGPLRLFRNNHCQSCCDFEKTPDPR